MTNNIRKEYSGGAVDTNLAAAITAVATSFTVDDGSTFPTGATYPFVISVDRDTAYEEKMLVTRSGNTFAVTTRGYDSTTAQSHLDNASVSHTLDAFTIDQANYWANIMTTTGDLAYKASSSTFGRLAIGAGGKTLTPSVATGGIPTWAFGNLFANAAARDAMITAPTEGAEASLLDTNCKQFYSGTGWSSDGPKYGVLPSYTPVVVQGATPTLTNTKSTYSRNGRQISGSFSVNTTSNGTALSAVTITVPVAMAGGLGTVLGTGYVYDASALTLYPATLIYASSTTVTFAASTNGANLGLSSAPFTAALANGDTLAGMFVYEATADA